MYLLSILLFTFVYLLSFNSVIEENRDRYSIQTFAIVMITIFLISMPVTTTFVSLMLEENQIATHLQPQPYPITMNTKIGH